MLLWLLMYVCMHMHEYTDVCVHIDYISSLFMHDANVKVATHFMFPSADGCVPGFGAQVEIKFARNFLESFSPFSVSTG
jgi:hypothetical protein